MMPARMARSAWSSCAIGAPKNAITASPMNLSSVPPYAKIESTAAEKKRDRNSATSSGAFVSDTVVNPEMSAKRIDTSAARISVSSADTVITPFTISSMTAGE